MSLRETRASLVEALLAATPAPPRDVSDDALLGTARVMAAAREAILATADLSAIIDGSDGVAADPSKVAELAERQNAWQDALAAARIRVGGHRVNTAKLRAYRPRQP